MQNLDKFFSPKSIAVIGASRNPEKLGHTILENLKLSFKGEIYPINPNIGEIMGLTAYPSVLEVEEHIDQAIIVIPAEDVNNVVKECIRKKIKAIVIISSGFSEIGENKREEELIKISRGKTRIIGPNCIGIYEKGLDMIFFPINRLKRPIEGFISFITQSGAFGSVLLDIIANKGVGVSKFISIGNTIDVNEIDLLKYLEKDLTTRCIAIYLESTKNGKEFIKTAKRVSRKKPIVCFKAGKTKKGAEAVSSHTGMLAGSAEVYSGAFKQAGIIEAKTSDQIFDFAKALANQPVLKKNKIAIVTDGGGFGIVATDAAINCGLELAELSKETVKKLKSFLPKYAITKNPVDLTGDATVERYEKTMDAVLRDKNVYGVVCIALMQIPTLTEEIVTVLGECKIHGKPITVCAAGGNYVMDRIRKLEKLGIPVYPTPERAVKAMSVLYEYGKIVKKK
ncbi:MAG: acetate--CoA ligase family protein [Candidatus Aenigmatarchaeota archaeon]